MRTILFLEQFSNISGGQRVLLNTIAALDRTKYTPFVVIPGEGELAKELDKLGVKHFILPVGDYSTGKKNIIDIILYLLRSPVLIPRTFFLIRQNNIDLVYANAPRTFLWGTLAASWAGKPVIWHLHSVLSGMELKISAGLLRKYVARMIAVSSSVAGPFIKLDSALAKKISVVYNGVDAKKFDVIPDAGKLRRELGVAEGKKIIAFIGQVAEWKGVEDFVRAAEHVLGERKDVQFIVVGDVLFGNRREQGYKLYLHELVSALGIAENFRFVGKRGNIPEILSLISMLVIPSIKPDPCPLVLLEAMASGRPVIASDHGGPGEIIRDGVDGLKYRPSDHMALAAKISVLLDDDREASGIGDAARRRTKSDLSFDHYMSSVSSLVDENLVS